MKYFCSKILTYSLGNKKFHPEMFQLIFIDKIFHLKKFIMFREQNNFISKYFYSHSEMKIMKNKNLCTHL